MPVVFSPGEGETRPFYPDDIVYTSVQKVADILGIGPGEAMLVAQDSTANAVYVTGADFRDHGFEVGDTILIYSDADPLGNSGSEYKITSIATNSPGIQLNFAETITHANFQVADNTYVQNTASFTNGKTRGVTKAIVETRIKEIQDRIDSTTHNAWRPYLAVAEYINFDTYKPYRRRYYTDYVGTTPLLFRNVQQILRIELWQGANYRELAGAEVRIEIVDHSALAEDNSFTVGGGIYNDDPTITHTASTSIIVGMGVSGTGIPADATVSSITSPTIFELSASTTGGSLTGQTLTFSASESIFLCPGGGGFSKLAVGTGTQQWNAAFNKVTTAQSLADLINYDDRTNRGTVTFTTNTDSPSGTSYTLPDASSNNLANVYVHNEFLASANADYGSGKLKITSMQPSGGNEATIAVTDTTNISVSQTENVTGSGTIDTTPSDGARTITFTDSSSFAQYGLVRASTGTIYGYATNSGTVLGSCRLLDAGTGVTDDTAYTWTQDKLQDDLGFISGLSGDKARLKDWWLDSEMGIIYFNNSYPFFEWNAVKVSYVYGERYVEKAIEEAVTKLVASDLLMADDRSILIPEGTQNVDLASKIQLYRKEAQEILNRYKEVVVFD
jgi:hypothetical protein